MGILLQKIRLKLALCAALSRLLSKAGEASSVSSTGRSTLPFDSHNIFPFYFWGGAAPKNKMERVMGIEPTLSAWEADALPLSYTRLSLYIVMPKEGFVKGKKWGNMYVLLPPKDPAWEGTNGRKA